MTNLEKHISEMPNEEIKDSIIALNQKQLKFIKDSSYLNAINAINTLREELKNRNQNNQTGLCSEINLLDYYINKNINLLSNHNSLEEAIGIREELCRLSSIIDGYSIELNYVGELVDQQGIKIISKRDYNNIPYNSKKIEELTALLNESLNKVKDDYHKYIYVISQIILILPMRLVKENYFNIMKNTLIRNLRLYTKVEVENMIDEYKKQFDSSIKDGYGTKFDYYFREIQKLRNIDLSHKELDELDRIVNEIIKLTKEVNEIFDFILRLGLVSNMIIVISLTDDISISKEVEVIYHNWIEAIENQDKEKLDECKTIIEREIKKIEQGMLIDIEEFNLLNSEALNRGDFNYEELNKDLLHAKRILTYYNDSTLANNDMLFPGNSAVITHEYLEQIVDSLIQYINRSLAKMGNVERKVRMRKLLSKIELPFNGIDEFNNYIRYSLDNKVLDKEEINFTLDYILYFLDDLINADGNK